MAHTAGWISEIAGYLEAGNLDAWAAKRKDDGTIRDLLFRTAAKADLAGQLFVRAIEVPESTRKLKAPTLPAFLSLEFREAVEFFLSRYPEESDRVDEILGAYRARADEATALLVRRLAERAQAALAAHLTDGGDLRSFVGAVEAQSVNLGIEAPSHAYLETVFRTQVQTAYGAGRVRQLENEYVMAARSHVEYRTVGDNRVRANHAALDGLQFEIRDPEWKRIAPPNGFNCRCSVVSLDADEVTKRSVRDTIPDDGIPDAGFDGSPTALVEQPIT